MLYSYLLAYQMEQWCQRNLMVWFVWVWKLWEERRVGSKEWDQSELTPWKNLKPFYDEKGSFFVGFWAEFRWPLAWATVKLGECICCSLYTCFTFCLFVTSFFCHKSLCENFKRYPIPGPSGMFKSLSLNETQNLLPRDLLKFNEVGGLAIMHKRT